MCADLLDWPGVDDWHWHAAGDQALLGRLRLPDDLTEFKALAPARRDLVLQLLRHLANAIPAAWAVRWPQLPVCQCVPAYDSLLVTWDGPFERSTLQEWLTEQIAMTEGGQIDKAAAKGRLHRIAVVYDGPDLADLAERNGLSVPSLIELHSSFTYTVQIIGFAPGFAYLGDLPPTLIASRRSVPRIRVPAGSVAVAAGMTAIYPFEMPGGWNILGTTPFKIFDINQRPPVRFEPGDRVQFYPVQNVIEVATLPEVTRW